MYTPSSSIQLWRGICACTKQIARHIRWCNLVPDTRAAGSSLIELIVYLAALLFLFSLSFSWITRIYVPLSRQSAYINSITPLFSGSTKLCHDLYGAPHDRALWKKISETELIWPHAQHDIGWRYHNKKLTRTEGTYDSVTGRWLKKSKSLVAANMKSITFTMVQKDISVRAIEVAYALPKAVVVPTGHATTGRDYVLKQYIALRNRDKI